MIVERPTAIRVVRRRDSECIINLAKWRTWYADANGQDEGAAGNGSSGTSGKTPLESLPPDVQDYIKELRGEAKTARENRQSLQAEIDAMKTANQKTLAEQGNFKALHEQSAAEVARLKLVEERAAALDKVIRSSNEERIKAIPDSKKALVQPLIDVLPPEKLQEYLNVNPSLFTKEPAPDYDAGRGSGGSGGASTPKLTAEEQEIVAKSGMKPEDYLKAKAALTK